MPDQDLAPSIIPAADDQLLEIIAHLGAALMQVEQQDDPIIIGQVRSAHDIAKALRRQPVRDHA